MKLRLDRITGPGAIRVGRNAREDSIGTSKEAVGPHVDASYVGRILRLATSAPGIVEGWEPTALRQVRTPVLRLSLSCSACSGRAALHSCVQSRDAATGCRIPRSPRALTVAQRPASSSGEPGMPTVNNAAGPPDPG